MFHSGRLRNRTEDAEIRGCTTWPDVNRDELEGEKEEGRKHVSGAFVYVCTHKHLSPCVGMRAMKYVHPPYEIYTHA